MKTAMVLLRKFKTLVDLLQYFSDEQTCRNYLEQIRWTNGLVCPYENCKHDKVFRYTNGKVYKCAKCQRQYSVKVGTIFEDSKIPLQKWFAAIYLITSHKKGISSLQLHRDLGVTQKTAWFMLHRVRHTLGVSQPTEKLKGTIEADETFIGGLEANKHKNKRTKGTQGRSVETKTAVAGVIERGGELRAKKVKDTSHGSLRYFVVQNVEIGANLKTDEWIGYNGLSALFRHRKINHGIEEYVNGDTHVNNVEGFWSHLKRGISGIYHSVSAKHLQNYLDEFVFRYNTRTYSESNRFDNMLNNINTHLTYEQLINGNSGDNRQVENQQGTLSF